ncbi:30S ribosomal protein S20 [bacterium]|nr:30S ribosomal protein S20 [bacterium]
MANLASSKKDIRRTQRRTLFNDRVRNRVKKSVKSFNTYIVANNVEKAKEALPKVAKVLGKASQRNILNKKSTGRTISRLTKKLNKLITAANVETAKKSA